MRVIFLNIMSMQFVLDPNFGRSVNYLSCAMDDGDSVKIQRGWERLKEASARMNGLYKEVLGAPARKMTLRELKLEP